jgi:hypothetical protein
MLVIILNLCIIFIDLLNQVIIVHQLLILLNDSLHTCKRVHNFLLFFVRLVFFIALASLFITGSENILDVVLVLRDLFLISRELLFH